MESYFARLVADNDVGCTPTRFAELAGLGSSGDPNMLMLEAVSKLPLTPEEMQSLKHWTPTEWKKRTFDLGPESFRMHRVMGSRRHCKSCTRDAAYYRIWWDIRGFEICPVHDEPLVALGGGRRNQIHPYLGHHRGGITKHPPLSAMGSDSLEGYILQRLGVVEANVCHPLLDCETLDTVLKFAIATGRFLLNRHSKRKPSAAENEASVGFRALAKDDLHLEDLIAEWIGRYTPLASFQHASLAYLGHYQYLILNGHITGRLYEEVKLICTRACVRFGTAARAVRVKEALGIQPNLTSLSSMLGINRDGVEMLVERGSLAFDIDQFGMRVFPFETIKAIRDEVTSSVSAAEAAVALGCTPAEAERLAVSLYLKGWKGYIGYRVGGKNTRRYLRRELDDLVERLRALPIVPDKLPVRPITREAKFRKRTVSGLMAKALLGELEAFLPVGSSAIRDLQVPIRVRKPPGKPAVIGRRKLPDDAMARGEFFAMTRITGSDVDHLIRSGLLQRHHGAPALLVRKSALEFHLRCINVIHYLLRDGENRPAAVRKVQRLNVPLLATTPKLRSWIAERNELAAIIGTVPNPRDVYPTRWSELKDIANARCPSLVVPEIPCDLKTTICTSSRKFGFDVRLEESVTEFAIDFSLKIGWRRKIYDRHRREIHEALRSFTWFEANGPIVAKATARGGEEVETIMMELSKLIPMFRYKMP